MPAGDHVHAVGVLRFIIGPTFDRQVAVEVHRGIEDKAGVLYFQQLETHSLDWKAFKKLVGKEDFEAVLRVIHKCGAASTKEMKSLKKSQLQEFSDDKPKRLDVTDSL